MHCKLLMLLPHNSATLANGHAIILSLYPVKPRVPYRQHWEADFGDYFNIHSYSLRGADLVVALKLVLKACSSLSNFKTEVKCDKDLKETTTMSKSLF